MKDSLLSIKKLTPDYIVGVVDGEGSFTVYVRDSSKTLNPKRRVIVEPKFYIKLIEKDRKILERIKDFFGCGSIYFQKDNRKNHQHCYRYEVYNRNDLITIVIPFFSKNILQFASKKHDFKIFCEMMKIIAIGDHLSDKGIKKLLELKSKMH